MRGRRRGTGQKPEYDEQARRRRRGRKAMRQLGRIFTKPKGEERRFFHNHVGVGGGGGETDGDGRCGWKKGCRDGGESVIVSL